MAAKGSPGMQRMIRCQRCPVLIAAKPQQHVGVCSACRVASERLRNKRKKRTEAKTTPSDDPFYLRCCDCPRLFAYRGGVPSPRCPACVAAHVARRPVRKEQRYDATQGREEQHRERGRALSAYLRGRNR